MASAKYLEEAVNMDVDESAVDKIVDKLERQLSKLTAGITVQQQTTVVVSQQRQHNHQLNSAISNGGSSIPDVQQQKHGVANGAGIGEGSVVGTSVNNSQLTQEINKSVTITTLTPVVETTVSTTAAGLQQQNNAGVQKNQGQQQEKQQQQQTQAQQTAQQQQQQQGVVTTQTTPVHDQLQSSFINQVTTNQATTNQTNLQTLTKSHEGDKIISHPASGPATIGVVNNKITFPGQLAGAQTAHVPWSWEVTQLCTVGARPVKRGITLQTYLRDLPPTAHGHVICKTENGMYKLLRVGPTRTAGQQVGTTVVGPTAGTAHRLASVRQNGQFNSKIATTTATPTTVTTLAATAQSPEIFAQRQMIKKCRRMLANLLELTRREPEQVERNVRKLVQDLIDTKIEPEEFSDGLKRLLNASPQPCLIVVLKRSLPLLRQSLLMKEVAIKGIQPPPPNVVFAYANKL